MTLDLVHAFKQHFEIVPAFSEALKDEAYRVRHKVYCEDLKFEPLRQDQRETNEYDSYSQAFLLRNVQAKEYVGSARIIIPHGKTRTSPRPLKSLAPIDWIDRLLIRPSCPASTSQKYRALP